MPVEHLISWAGSVVLFGLSVKWFMTRHLTTRWRLLGWCGATGVAILAVFGPGAPGLIDATPRALVLASLVLLGASVQFAYSQFAHARVDEALLRNPELAKRVEKSRVLGWLMRIK